MDLTLPQLLLASLLVFAGALVQSAVGFGLAVIAAPLLYLIEPRLVPGPPLFLALVLSLLNVWKNRASLAVGELSGAVAGRIPGMLLALWLLERADPWLMSLLVAAAVLAAVLVSLAPVRPQPTTLRLVLAGLASGFMGTSTSIGGPPLALLYQHAHGERVRANLAGYFVVGSFMSLIGLTLIGHFDGGQLVCALALLPAALAGFLAARLSIGFWDRGRVRPALLLLCGAAAIGVLAKGLIPG